MKKFILLHKKKFLTMLVSSFNLSQSFNYVPNLFCKNDSSQRSIVSVYGPWLDLSYIVQSSRRARTFKCSWFPGIDSKEWIPPAYVAWQTGTKTLFYSSSVPNPHRLFKNSSSGCVHWRLRIYCTRTDNRECRICAIMKNPLCRRIFKQNNTTT